MMYNGLNKELTFFTKFVFIFEKEIKTMVNSKDFYLAHLRMKL